MKNFIIDKINEIYDDFMLELDEEKYYCDLKDLRYDGNNIPDYNNPLIQKYYLLRYMPAYLTEYYLMYKKMFRLNFLDNNPNIISIGCGCGIDFWGAKFARDKNFSDIDIRYTGIDMVDWDYRDNLDIEESYFINKDINEIERLDEYNYNVIIFPKSIGEFSINTFLKLKDIIANTCFTEKKIILLSSIRNTRNDFDIDRLIEIINIFTSEHNYMSLDVKDRYWHYTTNELGYYSRLEDVCFDFVYPEDIKVYLSDLNSKCQGFIKNCNNPCDDECSSMNRRPISTTSQIMYQIIRLEGQE